MKKYIIIMIIVPLLQACYDASLEFEDQFQPVVEAYLYVGKDLENVYLFSMISFGADSLVSEKITDAEVVLEGETDSWALMHNDSVPGLYYLLDTPVLRPGENYQLQIENGGEVLSASTVIPDDPPQITMSSTSLYIPYVQDMMDFRNLEMPDPVELTWENPEAQYFFLDIQNIESYPLSIMPDPPDDRPAPPGGLAFQMITEPTNGNFYAIEPRQLEYFGTHRIIFTSVNEEYVYLYNSLNQDSRELNEPYSNVENGLGIFTAFNSDTLYLEVIPNYQ